MREQFPVPLSSYRFWQYYWVTMRPYLLFISGIAGLAGMALITSPDLYRVGIAFIPFFFSYGLGQSLTDVFQVDTDSISSSYRPMVKGKIRKKDVFIISLAGLTFGVVILAVLNPVILIFGLIAVAGLSSYTFFKRRWWGGPPWNSWIAALLPLMGRLVDSNFNMIDNFVPPSGDGLILIYTMAALFFAYANFVVMGYFKDISADRKTGYRTVQVVFGWKAGLVYSDIVSLLAAFFTFLAISPVIGIAGLKIFPALTIFSIAIIINAHAQICIHKIRTEKETYKPIINVVRTLLLYSSAIIAAHQFWWLIFIAVYYFLFEIAVRTRPEKTQV